MLAGSQYTLQPMMYTIGRIRDLTDRPNTLMDPLTDPGVTGLLSKIAVMVPATHAATVRVALPLSHPEALATCNSLAQGAMQHHMHQSKAEAMTTDGAEGQMILTTDQQDSQAMHHALHTQTGHLQAGHHMPMPEGQYTLTDRPMQLTDQPMLTGPEHHSQTDPADMVSHIVQNQLSWNIQHWQMRAYFPLPHPPGAAVLARGATAIRMKTLLSPKTLSGKHSTLSWTALLPILKRSAASGASNLLCFDTVFTSYTSAQH